MISKNQPSILEVPEIHAGQFENAKNGIIKQDVNLFRGSVNFIFPLVNLTGRNGLDVNIGAQYESNTYYSAIRRNLEAPTGIMGLGWQLSFDKIIAEYKGANDTGTIQYKYVKDGGSNLLYRVDTLWQRGVLRLDLASDLNKPTLTSRLFTAILGQSITVDSGAGIRVVTPGKQWLLTDPVNEFSLIISLAGIGLNIYDGGLPFEAESFTFSRIRYYKEFEKWAITDKKGITRFFGGVVGEDDNGYKTSAGNSIQWGVRWGNWQGPSIVTHDGNGNRIQQQCPESWNIARTQTIWNDQVTYEYSQVTQLVGADGLPYTKACYLSKITGVFGRTAIFNYADKLYESNGAQNPREYADPNKNIPDNTPDAYQSKYETQYLDSISINSIDNKLLFQWQFGYALEQYAPMGDNPDLFGDSIKRVLTSITKVMPDGSILPPETFTYYPSSQPNAGGLATRTYKEGGVTTYFYEQTELTSCSRSLQINSPNQIETPRVWFGGDYAVVLWYDPNGRLYISAYTWIGRWVQWQPQLSPLSTPVNLDTLNVETQNDCFVVSFGSQNDEDFTILPYYKDASILGGWLEDQNDPINILASANDIQVTVGQSFFAINNISSNEVTRYTWAPYQKKWISDTLYPGSGTFGESMYFLSTANNVLIALNYDIESAPGSKNNILELFYLDDLNQWQKGDSIQAPEINVGTENPGSGFNWTPAPWVFVATYVTSQLQSPLEYNLSIYSWSNQVGQSYKFNPVVIKSYSQDLTAEGTSVVPYIAQLSANGMIASGPNLLRFNGKDWLENQNLGIQTSVTDENLYWFAPGPDIVLKTENTPDQIISAAQAFDPNTQSDSWTEDSISIFDGSPTDSRLDRYYPTAGNGYVSFDNNLYQRGNSTDWQNPLENPIQPQLPPDANITSLINATPCFFAYLSEQDGVAANTQLLLIFNGSVQQGPTLLQNFFSLVDSNGQLETSTNGKVPAGELSFVTYLPLSANFEDATSITLYRFLDGDMFNNFNAYPVYQVQVNDGFSTATTHYSFDPSNAAIDPDGIIGKYYSVQVYEGADSSKKNGWKEFTFNNGIGLHPDIGNPTAPAGFDGLPQSINIYDASGLKVKSIVYEWGIYDSVLETPYTPRLTPIRGSYALPKSTTEMQDGVSLKKVYTFDLAAGEEIMQVTSRYNSDGKIQNLITQKQLAFRIFNGLWFNHILTGLAQIKTLVQVQNEPPVVAAVKATTWKKFIGPLVNPGNNLPVWASFETYQWIGGTTSSDFNFTSWKSGAPPVFDYGKFIGWLLKSATVQRNNFGSPVLVKDAANRPHSVLFDQLGQYQVAKFYAADMVGQEAAYYGFESYENANSWQITAPAVITDTNAYTGRRSLSLVKGGTLTNQFTPENQQKDYVLGWWYATDPGFQKNNQSGWQIGLSQNGGPISGQTVIIPFEETNGEWQFAYARIKIDSIGVGKPVTINVKAASNSDQQILLDNVRFLPDVSHFSAQVYDPGHKLLTEKIDMGTKVERLVYDSFLQLIGKVGPFQAQANSYRHTYFSRQAAAGFNNASPNHKLSLFTLEGGYFEAFKGGTGWTQRWAVSNPSTNWTSGNSVLSHTSDTQSDTITAQDPGLNANFGLYFQLSNPVENAPLLFSDGFGIIVNANNKFIWDAKNNKWNITLEGKLQPLLQDNSNIPSSVLLVSTPGTVLFFVNNQLILSANPSSIIAGRPSIQTGKNKIAFSNLAGLKKPNIQVEFLDGAEKLRQKQGLFGANAIAGQLIYDETGKKIVATKNAPTRFGSTGANLAILVYNPNLVDESAFLANLDTSGIMTGDISSYYNGINNPSNDENYPYRRNRLEPSPLARVIETGRPGKDYAIINPNGSDPNSRPTVKFLYSNNSATPYNLPAGEYFTQTKIDQVGNEACRVIDKFNQVILKSSSVASSVVQEIFTADGKTLNHYFPNYFDNNLPGNNKFFQSTQYNLLSKIIQTDHPDEGTQKFIQNSGGHKRFYQDAEGAANGYFIYIKYDALNRIIEKGVYHDIWDEPTLRNFAQIPDWPANDPKQVIQNQISYVLHGSTVNGIGKIASATSFNAHSGFVVQETFTYDSFGHLDSRSLLVSNGIATALESTISYKHSFTGKIVQITYPKNILKGIPDIFYTYDQFDRLIGIGEIFRPFKHARFVYNDAGELSSVTKNQDKIIDQYAFFPPGWIKSIVNPGGSTAFSQVVTLRFADGKVKSIQESIQTQSVRESLNYNMDFDELNQLSHVQYNENPAWTLAVQEYDYNGNVLNLMQGTESEVYGYQPGSNQLTSVKSANIFDFQGTYNKNGGLKTLDNPNESYEFTYLAGRGLTATVNLKKSNQALSFSYDHHGNRVVKTLSQGGGAGLQKFYIQGENPLPVVTIENGNPVAYIYGPNGLIAFYKDRAFYYVTHDHLGSNRLVQDQAGNTIAVLNYQAYGKLGSTGGTNPSILSYLYTGQELDPETGFYNYRARLYDPVLGRFCSPDPKNQTASPYVYVNNDPFDLTDPTGESFLGDMFSWIGQMLIDITEVVAAVAIDIATEGGGTLVTGGLLGAGINGAFYDLGALAAHQKMSWKSFAAAQTIGAVSGAATAGFGALGDAAEGAIIPEAEEGAQQAVYSTGRILGAKAVNVGIQAVGGAVTGVAGKLIENGFEGAPAGEGLGTEALVGFLSAGVGGTIGKIGDGIVGPNPTMRKNILKALIGGTIGGAAGGLIAAGIEKEKINGLDLGLAIGMGAIENVTGIRKEEKEEEEFNPMIEMQIFAQDQWPL